MNTYVAKSIYSSLRAGHFLNINEEEFFIMYQCFINYVIAIPAPQYPVEISDDDDGMPALEYYFIILFQNNFEISFLIIREYINYIN